VSAKALSQRELDQYKMLFPNDQRLQALTLDELLENTNGGIADWSSLPAKPLVLEASVWSCVEGIGFVIFDCVCLFLGATALRSGTTESEAKAIAEAAEPVLPQLKQYVKVIKDSASSKTEIASAVFGVISTIYSGACLGAVISSFLGSLSWYTAILYGATALGTIMAALATDGAAEIGLIIVELATAGFLVNDSIKCAESCSI